MMPRLDNHRCEMHCTAEVPHTARGKRTQFHRDGTETVGQRSCAQHFRANKFGARNTHTHTLTYGRRDSLVVEWRGFGAGGVDISSVNAHETVRSRPEKDKRRHTITRTHTHKHGYTLITLTFVLPPYLLFNLLPSLSLPHSHIVCVCGGFVRSLLV